MKYTTVNCNSDAHFVAPRTQLIMTSGGYQDNIMVLAYDRQWMHDKICFMGDSLN